MPPAGSRYKRLRTIASGGMGTVFLGRMEGSSGFERLVAIKVVHPHLAGNTEVVSMFLDEARLAASIRHPNVVSTLDIDASEEGLSLVMEYVDGPSLRGLVQTLAGRGEKVPLEIALRIMIDALSGLHAAHQVLGPDGQPANLVHRDVSPHNILLGTDGVARITDFGVARAEGRLSETRAGEVKGKFAYMSIEQMRGRPVDRRSDVYSAGVVLWELLAGQPLFKGESGASLMLAAVAGPLQSPRDVDAKVPAEIDDVCMRALCKAPEDRWPTAAAFAEALEDAAAAIKVRVARARDVAMLIAEMDEDGPTRLKPQAAEEWMARLALARKSGSNLTPGPAAPAPPATAEESGVRATQPSDAPARPTARSLTEMLPQASDDDDGERTHLHLGAAPDEEDDGPTKLRPEAAQEWADHIARQRAAARPISVAPASSSGVRAVSPGGSEPVELAQAVGAGRPAPPKTEVLPVMSEPAPAEKLSGLGQTAKMQPSPLRSLPTSSAPPASAGPGRHPLPTAAAPSNAPASPVKNAAPPAAKRATFRSVLLGMAIGLVCLAILGWLVTRGPLASRFGPPGARPPAPTHR